jgi:hypothetical protein
MALLKVLYVYYYYFVLFVFGEETSSLIKFEY